MRYFFQWSLSGGETDTLHATLGDGLEPLEREGQVRAALGGDDGVDLVDDHGVHLAQAGGGVRGKQQVERLRGGDENLRWMPAEMASLFLRCVTGTDTYLGLLEIDSGLAGHICDPSERRTQIAFHIHGQSFEGADIYDPAAFSVRCLAVQHQAVQAPEKRRQGLAGSGRRENQGAFT